MALRWFDGFDPYSVNELSKIYDSSNLTNAFVTGRFGGQAIRHSSPQQGFVKIFDAQPTWIVGFAIFFTTFTSGDPGNDVINLWSFRDGARRIR